MTREVVINSSYFVVAFLFILGLKGMSSPVTARRGITWAGAGMVLATLVTFAWPGMGNYGLMIIALILGGGISWWSGRVVRMTDMPQMVALFNGMGGGSAAAIAAIELARGETHGTAVTVLAALGALIGSTAFSGSCIAFAKLQGILRKTMHLPGQNAVNVILAVLTIISAIHAIVSGTAAGLAVFFGFALLLGVIITIPIGGADMPVVISLLNALTGLAVGFEGYVLNNPAMMIAGVVVGAAGSLLTRLMAKAMNRPLFNVLFKPITGEVRAGGAGITGTMKEISALDAAAMLRYARKVIIVPGYGMAVGQAQHKIREMTELLEEVGVEVKFAIHPVAGRMPGHMNVLLAEADVPYEKIFDLEEINEEFSQTDVTLVIGANDVVNPAARTDKSSPIYGMPILNADRAQNVIVIKRGKGAGYSGTENPLFYAENARMLYGNAQTVVGELIKDLKELMS
ncbi:MAG: NAD(P)(+) transhydrogenase (Re/Si-specific) subunit beta [Nitrospirae bacterium]|nr:NAD(P)(+) transhydrogenase (Re/Si-specific) subunit beta [Nitrospirota bacterium]